MAARNGEAPPALPAAHSPAPVQAAPVAARSYDEAKIQIRLTNGKTLVQVSEMTNILAFDVQVQFQMECYATPWPLWRERRILTFFYRALLS